MARDIEWPTDHYVEVFEGHLAALIHSAYMAGAAAEKRRQQRQGRPLERLARLYAVRATRGATGARRPVAAPSEED